MKIQYRIALIFAVLTISIVIASSAMEYYFANQNAFEDFYKRLEIRAFVVARSRVEEKELNKSAYEEIRKQHLEKLPYEQEYFLPAGNYKQTADSLKLEIPLPFYIDLFANGTSRYRNHDIFYFGYLYTGQNLERTVIIVSAKNEIIDSYQKNLFRIITISIIASAILSSLIGLWFSKLMLRPIRLVTEKMQTITATQLHLRLSTGKGQDEISKLSGTFNLMLDRLEASFETQKNFISNASHELNTPLTTIIGESEYSLSKPRNAEEYTRSLAVILEEAERLKKITSSLLRLAQTGYNGKTQELTPVRIDEIIYSVKLMVDNIIPNNKVYVNLSLMPEDQGKLIIKANVELLEMALANIVLNGCKYSNNQPVSITPAATNQKVIIVIEDKGIGIPEEEIGFIYDPFFRASNTGKFDGYGIGLPLSRNIIRLHNGELDVTSRENIGTKIKITLPLCNAYA